MPVLVSESLGVSAPLSPESWQVNQPQLAAKKKPRGAQVPIKQSKEAVVFLVLRLGNEHSLLINRAP